MTLIPVPDNSRLHYEQAEALWRAGDVAGATASLVMAAAAQADLPQVERLALEIGAPVIAPMLEAGLRPVLIQWLSARQQQQPTQLDLAHTLGLLHYGWAHELEAAEQVEQALAAWEGVIANWGMLLDNEEFLLAWTRSRLEVYAAEFKTEYINATRQAIAAQLIQVWNDCAGRHAAAGHEAWARRYQDLVLLFQVEREGVKLVQQIGGLPA